MSRERTIILERKPALLIMHGLREVMDIQGIKETSRYQFGCASLYRKHGIIAVRLVRANYPREYVPAVEFSDVILDAKPVGIEKPDMSKFNFKYVFWKTFKGVPCVIDGEDFVRCLKS